MELHGLEEIDILAIDTEGLDYEIVSGVLDEKLRIGAVLFEFINMRLSDFNELISRLEASGFVIARSGYDILAVHREVLKRYLTNLLPN